MIRQADRLICAWIGESTWRASLVLLLPIIVLGVALGVGGSLIR